jgi:ATP-dependent DNA helicase DinG|tara:strand:- start:31958 stop:34105 length:2148 start_codon:yes stop_codon:yes gene_type:complete
MQIMRLGAANPPDKNRSKWARDLVIYAIDRNLQVANVPAHTITAFSASLQPVLAAKIQALCDAHDLSPAQLSAGLIKSALDYQAGAPAPEKTVSDSSSSLVGEDRVRPLLTPLLRSSYGSADGGKIAFAEAATGTGKGRMIASLAAEGASKGKNVVVAAPLAVTWQLLDDLAAIPETSTQGVRLMLGRSNFVNPALAREWAFENGVTDLVDWIDNGGKPLSEKAKKASGLVKTDLCWLLEDALSLAEELPVSTVMLQHGETKEKGDCPAEALYQSIRNQTGIARITLCSHHMLASHVQQVILRKISEEQAEEATLSLPFDIDLLIVDEAHLLETAVSSINTHDIHLRTLQRRVKADVTRGKQPILKALDELSACLESQLRRTADKRYFGPMSDFGDSQAPFAALAAAIEGVDLRKVEAQTGILLRLTRYACLNASKASYTLKAELSPVRNYPSVSVGRANLSKSLETLWDRVAGAVLVSATLYSEGDNAKLLRWKLAVPQVRAHYLPPVHPKWTTEPVSLMATTTSMVPDDSDEWLEELAAICGDIAHKAKGGTLILSTSYQNALGLGERLAYSLGPRVIIQSRAMSAAACAVQYRALAHAGLKPVWVGLGAAWTGIDLTNHDVAAEADNTLTDLVIARLPVGANRTITHERRVAIAGFSIVVQEACWQLRQGIGRLVRREGMRDRKLWVLDSRATKGPAWAKPFSRILAAFKKE